MRWLALLFVLLAACRPEVIRTSEDSKAIYVAEQAWREAGGASLKHCPTGNLNVIHARTPEAFDQYCGTGAHLVAASCFNYQWARVMLRPGQELEPDGEPVIHELLHYFVECETHGLTADAEHGRRNLWKANGPGTIQERAEQLFVAP